MTQVSLGDLARSFQLRRENARLNETLQRLTTELASGRKAVPELGRGGDSAPLAAIERSLSALAAYRLSANEAATIAEATQAVLSRIGNDAGALSGTLLLVQGAGQPALVDAAGAEAVQRFAATVSGLNTTVAGWSIFAGQRFDGPALAEAEAILADLSLAVAGQTTAAGVLGAVEAWFAPGGGFDTVGYLGAPADTAPVRIGDGETVDPEIRADDPGLREMLRGMAAAALLDRGVLAGNEVERALLARSAGEALLAAATPLVDLQSGVGSAERRIAEARSRIAAEQSALDLARAEIVSADPFETATRLAEAERQLEALYVLTGRLSGLSLTDYLR